MSTTALGATIDVTVRVQTAGQPDVDVELGIHERVEGRRIATHLAAYYGGHTEDASEDEDSTSAVVVVVPPRQTASDPRTAERMQRIAAIRKTLLVTEPDTAEYDSLARELLRMEPVSHRPPPRPESIDQESTVDETSAS